MSETYIHSEGKEFKQLPEIYQIELTNACNLKCPMCLRTTDMVRDTQLLDIALLKKMHKRGDFRGSFYTELQMAGEPTLHPGILDITRFLRNEVGVLVGCSTHGLQIPKSQTARLALLEMDAVTISVDSVDPEIYHKMRFPAKLEQLIEALDYFFNLLENRRTRPFVELQLVITTLAKGSGNVEALQRLMDSKGWSRYASIRTTYDCFEEMQGRFDAGSRSRNSDICLNPFTSVSVAHNGDVVSCCYIFEPRTDEVNYYGNLYQNSLEEIWYGERVEAMRRMHIANAHLPSDGSCQLTGQCAKCYLKSPCSIHTNIVSRLVRIRGTQG